MMESPSSSIGFYRGSTVLPYLEFCQWHLDELDRFPLDTSDLATIIKRQRPVCYLLSPPQIIEHMGQQHIIVIAPRQGPHHEDYGQRDHKTEKCELHEEDQQVETDQHVLDIVANMVWIQLQIWCIGIQPDLAFLPQEIDLGGQVTMLSVALSQILSGGSPYMIGSSKRSELLWSSQLSLLQPCYVLGLHFYTFCTFPRPHFVLIVDTFMYVS